MPSQAFVSSFPLHHHGLLPPHLFPGQFNLPPSHPLRFSPSSSKQHPSSFRTILPSILNVREILEHDNDDNDDYTNNDNKHHQLSPSPSSPSSSESLPLGAPGGRAIDNKSTILSDVDKLLGVSKPPAVEFIFVEPYASWKVFGSLGLAQNPYGHAAIRYTLPDGTQKVMNIVGFKTEQMNMVNFVSPEEYFFGTTKYFEGCEQMGVYNRHYVSVRIEDYPPEKIMDMDHYFNKLERRAREKKAKYSLAMAPFWNFVRHFPFPLINVAERGNCAWWTSTGLFEAELVKWPALTPKSIWIELFERWGRKDRNNVHVVSYRRVNSAQLTYGKPLYAPSVVEPLNTITNFSYLNLERFADVIVEVPEGQTRAVARRQENPLQPSAYRFHNMGILVGSAAALYGIFRFIRR